MKLKIKFSLIFCFFASSLFAQPYLYCGFGDNDEDTPLYKSFESNYTPGLHTKKVKLAVHVL